eukprot:3763107-Amphidinium_carterae.1
MWATEPQHLGELLAAPAPGHLHQLALELSAAYGVQPSSQPDVVQVMFGRLIIHIVLAPNGASELHQSLSLLRQQGVLPDVAVIAECGLARWRLEAARLDARPCCVRSRRHFAQHWHHSTQFGE